MGMNEPKPDDVTPPELYFNRRKIMRAGTAVASLAATASLYRFFNPVKLAKNNSPTILPGQTETGIDPSTEQTAEETASGPETETAKTDAAREELADRQAGADGILALDDVDVGAADRRQRDPDDGLAGARPRSVDLLDADVLGGMEHVGAHGVDGDHVKPPEP